MTIDDACAGPPSQIGQTAPMLHNDEKDLVKGKLRLTANLRPSIMFRRDTSYRAE